MADSLRTYRNTIPTFRMSLSSLHHQLSSILFAQAITVPSSTGTQLQRSWCSCSSTHTIQSCASPASISISCRGVTLFPTKLGAFLPARGLGHWNSLEWCATGTGLATASSGRPFPHGRSALRSSSSATSLPCRFMCKLRYHTGECLQQISVAWNPSRRNSFAQLWMWTAHAG